MRASGVAEGGSDDEDEGDVARGGGLEVGGEQGLGSKGKGLPHFASLAARSNAAEVAAAAGVGGGRRREMSGEQGGEAGLKYYNVTALAKAGLFCGIQGTRGSSSRHRARGVLGMPAIDWWSAEGFVSLSLIVSGAPRGWLRYILIGVFAFVALYMDWQL